MDEQEELLLDTSHYEDVLEQREDIDLTFGEYLSDIIASFGGSWYFIIFFVGFLILWVLSNLYLTKRPIDPYPFVFLNLILSMVAALQAPFIMMSQRRQDDRDRERTAYQMEMTRRSLESAHKELLLMRRQLMLLTRSIEKKHED